MKEQSALKIPETMTAPLVSDLADLPVSTISFANDALFLDFDGTLADIAPAPDMVAFVPETRAMLEVLVHSFSGAVAIVTGRQMSEIDRHLDPLRLPIAGLYGLVHRSADGHILDRPAHTSSLPRVSAALKEVVNAHPGLLLELKGQTIALHYRARPDLAATCLAAARDALRDRPDLKLIPGKMVLEIAPAGADKGQAVHAFLSEAPFKGRRPVYVGDDISDEAAFAAVNALGGIAIKIGLGETAARYRAPSSKAILTWLKAVSERSPAG